MNKDMKLLIDYASSHGWEIVQGGKHVQFRSPEGQTITCPGTPSDWRSFRNTVADLRRAGLDVKRKTTKPKRKEKVKDYIFSPEGGFVVSPVPVIKYPHITAILGQWRNPSWFDEDGEPIGYEDWFGTEEVLSQYIMMTYIEENGRDRIPPPRKFRIMIDSFMFWVADDAMDRDEIADRVPTRCTCGMDFRLASDVTVELASHIVGFHERCDFDHAPDIAWVRPWTDPALVAEVFDDSMEVEVERLTRSVKEANERAEKWKDKYAHLRRAMREVVEEG